MENNDVHTLPVRVEQTEGESALQPPPKYHVMLVNDDYTPMDFVVEVLQTFFYMSNQQATDIMLMVHHQGHAICGTYTADIAHTKVELVNDYATQHDHPLLCKAKPVTES